MRKNPRGFVALAQAGPIEGDGRQWIEVMPTADKARNGPWHFTITAADLDTYAAFIAENADRIVIDRDHEGADGGSTKAAGWFTGDTEVVDDPDRGPILRAEVQWTPTAKQEITDGEFRFVSPEFSFVDRDKKSGLMTKAKEFLAATLTNRPFFDELAALAADGGVVWRPEMGYQQISQKLSGALNPGRDVWDYWVLDVDLAASRALIQESGSDGDTFVVPFTVDAEGEVTVGPSADWVEAEQEWVAAANSAADSNSKHTNGGESASKGVHVDAEQLKALAATLGLPEDATAEQINEAVVAAKEKADQAGELETEITELKAAAAVNDAGGDRVVAVDKERLAALERDAEMGVTARRTQLQHDADSLVASAVKEGSIAPASQASWRTAILPEGATELVASEVTALAALEKGRVPLEARGSNPSPDGDSTSDLGWFAGYPSPVKETVNG